MKTYIINWVEYRSAEIEAESEQEAIEDLEGGGTVMKLKVTDVEISENENP